MLKGSAKKRHLSFHTPGHKRGKWDLTELSYTDNLSAPNGCIAKAEEDIARILGAEKSFILTDGSTCGVLAMLYAAKKWGATAIAFPENAHKSVWNGCALLGLTPLVFSVEEREGIPLPPTLEGLQTELAEGLQRADALLLTSPDYYGNIPNLSAFRRYCEEERKLLLVDGAHGGHLHFDERYAGKYAHILVDGVHKSLPALTQGAVLSTFSSDLIEGVREGADTFRTTSPSYPIMASVEYAVKYPENPSLEKSVRAYAKEEGRAIVGEDWTKLCLRFGENAFLAHAALEKEGIYAEFCDGNVVEFYLSPVTTKGQFQKLKRALAKILQRYPYIPKKDLQRNPAPLLSIAKREKEWVPLAEAKGRICAANCGLFPPCAPLIRAGEEITEAQISLLRSAVNAYGLTDNKILVVKV